MKNVFLLLLLANLVFAMWWLWIEPTDRPNNTAAAPGVAAPRLVLASEVDAMLTGETKAREVAGLALAAPEPISPSPDETAPPPNPQDAAGSMTDATPSDDVSVDALDGVDTVEVGALPGEPELAQIGPDEPAPIETAMVEVAVPPSVPPEPARCVSVGPFLDLAEATAAASKLRSDGFESRQRLAESDVWMGYWVHLPAYPSRAAAVVAVTGLREQGINDIYIEPAGELRNTVSLGIFSDRTRADAHAGRMRALGVEPDVTDRYRRDQAYWIDVDLAADRALDTSAFSSSPSQSVRVEDGVCVE